MPRKRMDDQPAIEVDIQVPTREINERDHTRTLAATSKDLSIQLVAARLCEDLMAITEPLTHE